MQTQQDAILRSEMRVIDIVTLVPQAAGVMAEWGLHCGGCSVGGLETLAEGCRAHGLSEEDIVLLLRDIEEARRSLPPRPQTLCITAAAARALREVASAEGKHEERTWQGSGGIAVVLDGSGGFCMEFQDGPKEGDATFVQAEVPELRFFASVLTLGRIGGATIDMRDGRFKLDLPEDACGCAEQICGCGGGGAGCNE
ncbi:DUF1858 domain-containing protein [Candidatus Peribacteria bacterium]|nr:DUF1858 domain-containing protein [Candidatus Peribacteria bacterium]